MNKSDDGLINWVNEERALDMSPINAIVAVLSATDGMFLSGYAVGRDVRRGCAVVELAGEFLRKKILTTTLIQIPAA